MNKWAAIFPICFLALLAAFALHTRNSPMNAVPENLWTCGGQWGKPSNSMDMESFARTEYGYPWAWLVVDNGISVDAWYAKMDTKYLIFYAVISALTVGIVARITKKRRTTIKPPVVQGQKDS